ncbi:hypothetical protein BRD00_14535 [Halobacteriales archaeon QS_8_69_26]|nr:MAG: hypothetical protein BRD00_14535 [Halobacteriales archaeon QS_8_69_26]
MVLSSVAVGSTLAADAASGHDVQIDPTPTDPSEAESTHAVRMTVADSAVAGSDLKNVFVDYSLGAEPADVSNVGAGTIERVGIDRGNDDPGTQIDVSATVTEVTGQKDGTAVKIETNQNLTIQQGDQIVVVLSPVQNPQNAGTFEVGVTVNEGLDPSISATTSVTYEYNDASVDFADQSTTGETVTIDRVNLSEGGFVAVSNESGRNPSAVRGVSDYLGPGVHEDVTVTLDQPVESDTTLYATAHTDDNANRLFDYSESGGEWDAPYLDADGNVMGQDDAQITHTEGEPSTIAVSIDSTNSPVTAGDQLDVTATVENTGDSETTETVTLDVGGSQRDSTSVTLGAGESTQVTLSWATSSGDAGDYTATVAAGGDSASTTVTVQSSDGGNQTSDNRSVDSQSIDAGDSTTSTVEVSPDTGQDRVAVVESVSPAVESLSIQSVEIGGSGSVATTAEGPDQVSVAVEGVGPDTTITVSYEIVTSPAIGSADQLEISGEIYYGGTKKVDIGTTVIDVQGGGLSAYDIDDDGVIETPGLREAVSDWAADDISLDFLQEVVEAWASEENVAQLRTP